MGKAKLRVSAELLERLLSFPKDTHIIYIKGYTAADDSVELGIISPYLPINVEGTSLPEADYILNVLEDGSLNGRFVINEQSIN